MEYVKEKALERINELFGCDCKDFRFSITYGPHCIIKDISGEKPVILYSTPNRYDKIFDEISGIIESVWQLEKAEVELIKILKDWGVLK